MSANAETTSLDPPKSFMEIYGGISLRELCADWPLEDLTDEEKGWLGLPPLEFLEWARGFPRYPSFDGIPPSSSYKKAPSFLLSQTHKFWLSGRLVSDRLGPHGSLVDFGSFPFSLQLALRSYFGHQGPSIATVIQPIEEETRVVLARYRVDVAALDLDPHVIDRTKERRPPDRLNCSDGSVDVVTMLHVIEHLYHPMLALREAYRILKPGGRIIITTDNAMMLNTLLNYIAGYGYIFESVSSTCAMSFSDWRGHVRFFTAADLQTMLAAVGFSVKEVGYEEVFYDVMHEDYFVSPMPQLPRWRKPIIREHPQFRNDVYVIAVK